MSKKLNWQSEVNVFGIQVSGGGGGEYTTTTKSQLQERVTPLSQTAITVALLFDIGSTRILQPFPKQLLIFPEDQELS